MNDIRGVVTKNPIAQTINRMIVTVLRILLSASKPLLELIFYLLNYL